MMSAEIVQGTPRTERSGVRARSSDVPLLRLEAGASCKCSVLSGIVILCAEAATIDIQYNYTCAESV